MGNTITLPVCIAAVLAFLVPIGTVLCLQSGDQPDGFDAQTQSLGPVCAGELLYFYSPS